MRHLLFVPALAFASLTVVPRAASAERFDVRRAWNQRLDAGAAFPLAAPPTSARPAGRSCWAAACA
jgi:hypothetical protein